MYINTVLICQLHQSYMFRLHNSQNQANVEHCTWYMFCIGLVIAVLQPKLVSLM